MLLSILIVNWNTRDLLVECLHSIEAQCRDLEYEVIVVDNMSADGSAAAVKEKFPRHTLIEPASNTGFAGGNNLAYAHSSGRFIWLLNPDTELLPGSATALLTFLKEHPEAGAVSSALVDARDGHIQRSCRTFPTPAALWTQALGLASAFPRSRRFGFYKMGWWNYRDARPVDQPMASSLMLAREAVQASGGLFDEAFPIFFNDVDLCWRLQMAGYSVWFLPGSRVKHWGGAATTQLGPEMITESHNSLRRFYEKHYRSLLSPALFFATLAMVEVSGRARRIIAGLRQRKQRPSYRAH